MLDPCFTSSLPSTFYFFFFNDTATTEIYTLSLHDALPISRRGRRRRLLRQRARRFARRRSRARGGPRDRKSTRLNSSHQIISYAVFCLKKKNERSLTSEQWKNHQCRKRASMP